jgi:hypothetical protein
MAEMSREPVVRVEHLSKHFGQGSHKHARSYDGLNDPIRFTEFCFRTREEKAGNFTLGACTGLSVCDG